MERLLAIKADHERTVVEAMDEGLAEVGFPELEAATGWISGASAPLADRDYSRIPIDAKISKHGLSIENQNIIVMHLGAMPQVRGFIQFLAKEDADFPDRLRAGFLSHYFGLRRDGTLAGDELFTLMSAFACRGFRDMKTRSAALAVLIYLFETCEVFEQ